MKLSAILTCTSAVLAASWSASGGQDSQLAAFTVNTEDKAMCLQAAKQFINQPMMKGKAVQRAMDHCALDKKVDDKNFVCPHYKEILNDAFRREDTTKLFTADSFCDVTEVYVSQMQGAHKIPNLGKGAGFEFMLRDSCESTVQASFAKGKSTLPANEAPDFWYATCMNQDCAHFLPSRTRWCSHDHAPAHSASVCEAVRHYAKDKIFVMEKAMSQDLSAAQTCKIYDQFVEDTHVNVEAYLHVVRGTEDHPVPSPENRARALKSAQMKNTAGKNSLRDSAASPVKSDASTKKVSAAAMGALAVLALVA